MKIVKVIPNFAKRFSMNSKFNTLLWGIVIFFSFLHKFESFKTKLVFAEAFEFFFPTKSFEESFENHISKLAKKK